MAIGKTNASIIIGGSGGQDAVLREYTSSATWTKPAGLKYLLAIVVGGGGGGQGGINGAGQGGGLFGGGGNICFKIFDASELGTTESIVIGSGGTGGAGAANTTYINGTNGGFSSFGSLVANGGEKGSASAVNNSNRYLNALYCPSGGRGGGAMNPTTLIASQKGGALVLDNGSLSTAANGGGNTQTGEHGLADVIHYFSSTLGLGNGGGGGGGAMTSANGGNGGNGGNYGAGGGGGGSCLYGGRSGGNGGNGAGGLCIVIEIY